MNLYLHVGAASMVLISALGLARLVGRPYHARVRTLDEWIRVIRHLEPLMAWRQWPLGRALVEASRGQSRIGPAVVRWHERLSNPDQSFAEAWSGLLQELPGLWDADRHVLEDLGRVLGASDIQSQRSELQATSLELTRLMGDARRQEAQDGRLYPALVGALGVMVVLMML